MEAKRGKVITFYSYKGGTGRSMALANAACLLSRRSDVRRILVIDWDLDAPGLHLYFAAARRAAEFEDRQQTREGVVDFFSEISERMNQGASRRSLSESEAEDLIASVAWDKFVLKTGVEKVDLMPSGRIDATYGERVASFDWRSFFDAAPTLIRAFATHLAKSYDYVLVDSRTGVNDVSGICTSLMPDQLVFVFTPNNQSIDGGFDVLRRATNYRRESEDLRPLVIFPLQSRLEMSEPQLYSTWRFGADVGAGAQAGYQARFEKLFAEIYGLQECSLRNYFDEVQIQHVPRYSYGEAIAALVERAQGTRLSLSRSYAAFVDVLTKYEVPWAVTPPTESGADLVSEFGPTLVKVNAAKDYISDDRSLVRLHDLVSNEVRRVLPELGAMSYQGSWSVAQFEERLHIYEAICNDLLHIEIVLAFWGERTHERALLLALKRVVADIKTDSGLTMWLAMRWYPAMLLMYVAGIASVSAGKYENLNALFSITLHSSGAPDLVRGLGDATAELHDAFKALPNYERRHTPRSDYLNKLLQPMLDSVVFIGSDYEEAFDRFELLFALEYMHRSQRQSAFAWAPPGRFGWKFRRTPEDLLTRLVRELEAKGQDWEPIRAGLFGGSRENFVTVATDFEQFIAQLKWW